MKYFIIGDSYFLGYCVGKALFDDGHELVFYDSSINPGTPIEGLGKTVLSDITSEYGMKTSMSSFAPDAVLFLCGPQLDPLGNYNPLYDFRTVLNGIHTLCDTINICKSVKHVYLRTTSEIYGAPKSKRGIFRESDVCHPVSYAGAAALAGENLLRIHCYNNGIKFTSMRIFDTYGKDMSKNPTDIISLVCKSLCVSGTVGVYGLDTYKDFIHVEDVAKSVVRILENGYSGPINIGTGIPSKLKSVVSKISKLSIGKNGIISIQEGKLPSYSRVADISILKTMYTPEIRVADRLEEVFNFYSLGGKNVGR